MWLCNQNGSFYSNDGTFSFSTAIIDMEANHCWLLIVVANGHLLQVLLLMLLMLLLQMAICRQCWCILKICCCKWPSCALLLVAVVVGVAVAVVVAIVVAVAVVAVVAVVDVVNCNFVHCCCK